MKKLIWTVRLAIVLGALFGALAYRNDGWAGLWGLLVVWAICFAFTDTLDRWDARKAKRRG